MALIRCNICKGLKEYAPLGFIKIKCKACDGIGYIEHEVAEKVLMPLLNDISTKTELTKKQLKKLKKSGNYSLANLIQRVDDANTVL